MSSSLSSKISTHASTSIDSMMGMFLPKPAPPTTSSSFRTAKTSYCNDPELYMGDDSDADYAQALMQSGLFKDQDSDCSDTEDPTLDRLRLLLAHLDPPCSYKGKSKAYH